MAVFTIIVLFITLVLVRIKDKCLINPVTITSTVWLFLLIGYSTIDHGLYPLSNLFYVAFLAWIIPFQMACVMMRYVNNTHIKHLARPASSLITNTYVILFVSICMIIVVIMTYQQSVAYDSENWYHAIRYLSVASRRGEEVAISKYQIYANRFAQIGFVMCLIFSLRNIDFKYKYLFYLIVYTYLFFGANKMILLRFLFGYLAILVYKKELNIRMLLVVFLLICLSMYTLQFFRRGNSAEELDFIKLIYIYIYSPLTAFDYFILHSSSDLTTYFNGEFVFKYLPFVGKIFNENFDLSNVNYYNYEAVYVPLPTNVYSMLAGYWAGWKWSGLIIGGGLHGCFWGYVYERSRKMEVYKILYASIIYVLFFHFFNEFLMDNIRFNITLIIYLFFVFYHPKWRYYFSVIK